MILAAIIELAEIEPCGFRVGEWLAGGQQHARQRPCLLYTSDAADDLLCVDLGGRRIIKKKKNQTATIRTAPCLNHSNIPT